MRMTRSLPERFRHWRQREDRREPVAVEAPTDWHRANRISIYNEEAERISRFVMAYPNLETGGDLFGFWTNSGTPVVSYVIGPGRYSRHCYASFYQDAEWLQGSGTGLYDRHGLQHIGEWHSHHQLGLNQPSAGDIRTVVRGMEAKNWSKFVLMIATRDARPGSPVVQSYYLVNPDGDYKPLRPRVLPGGSPFRTGPHDTREEPLEGPPAHRRQMAGTPAHPRETRIGRTDVEDYARWERTQQAMVPPPVPHAVPTPPSSAGEEIRPGREREQRAGCAARLAPDGGAGGKAAGARCSRTEQQARRNLADDHNSSPAPHHGAGGQEPPNNEGADDERTA